MIKPDKNFNMSKPFKTMVALMAKNASERHGLKSMLIQAQLAEESAKRASLKSKGAKGKDLE